MLGFPIDSPLRATLGPCVCAAILAGGTAQAYDPSGEANLLLALSHLKGTYETGPRADEPQSVGPGRRSRRLDFKLRNKRQLLTQVSEALAACVADTSTLSASDRSEAAIQALGTTALVDGVRSLDEGSTASLAANEAQREALSRQRMAVRRSFQERFVVNNGLGSSNPRISCGEQLRAYPFDFEVDECRPTKQLLACVTRFNASISAARWEHAHPPGTKRPSPPPSRRFASTKDGLIADNVRRLYWTAVDDGLGRFLTRAEAEKDTLLNWADAVGRCREMKRGKSVFRLPTPEEAASLFDASVPGWAPLKGERNAIRIWPGFALSGYRYWTSALSGTAAVTVGYTYGEPEKKGLETKAWWLRVLCVTEMK